ncbi:MAG: GYD domain-containing protein [Acidimicrobiales bacterium]
MAKYLIQASYTLDGIKGVKAHGGSARREAVEQALKSVGGTVESFYFAFGDSDVYVIADVPGNVDAAAMSLATSAAGGAQTKTVVLLTAEEMDEAARKQVGYTPPS